MKILFFALASCVAGAVTALGDLTVVQTVEGLDQKTESTLLIKAGKTRMNPSPGTSILMDLKTGEMINLLHPQKSYVKIPGEMARAAVESVKKERSGQSDVKAPLAATGKKDTISGYAVEEYTCTVLGVKMSLWLTRALPDYQMALKEMAAAFDAGPLGALTRSDGMDMAHLPGFPMRTVQEIHPGQTLTSTVVSVSNRPIADAEFEIPAGYEPMALPTLTPPAAETVPAAPPIK